MVEININPFLSVIVTVYNMSDYIEECLVSILNNTYTNYELIIVNDGSKDDSMEKVAKFNDARIKIINKENGGASSARNVGLEAAKGEYIIFIDADDVITKDMFQLYVSYAQKHDADICYSGYRRFFHCVPPLEYSVPPGVIVLQKPSYFDTDQKRIVCTGKLFSKRLISGLKFKEGRIHEDEDFYTLLLSKDIRNIIYITRPLYFYRFNPSSVTHNKTKDYNLDAAMVFFERLTYLEKIDCKNVVAIKTCFDNLSQNLLNKEVCYPTLKRYSLIRQYGYHLRISYPGYHLNYFSSEKRFKIFCFLCRALPMFFFWALTFKQNLARIKNRD